MAKTYTLEEAKRALIDAGEVRLTGRSFALHATIPYDMKARIDRLRAPDECRSVFVVRMPEIGLDKIDKGGK